MKLIIFTDLDGTFLDHFTYSYSDLLPCLSIIKNKNIPLVFITSKTKVEVEKLIKDINYEIIFSVENGAAVYFPDKLKQYNKIFGKNISYLLDCYNKLKEKYDIVNIFEINDKALAKQVNMTIENIKFLKKREFSLPFLINNLQDFDNLQTIVKQYGCKILKGGRFYHLVSIKQDKGIAVNYIKNILNNNYKTVGLGDSGNDYDLLANVDIPIVVMKHDKTYDSSLIKLHKAIKTRYVGPKGWCDSLIKYLMEVTDG